MPATDGSPTQKIIFGVFAHPDDEAFGCAGTLIQETDSGSELHLVTLTDGGGGMNPDGHNDLGAVRLEEWRAAAELLGARTTHHFGYTDGQLDNVTLIAAAERLEQLIVDTVAGRDNVAVELMSLDLNGITGHIDHIVAGRLGCLVFYRLKQKVSYMQRLRLRCAPEAHLPAEDISWLYCEKGRPAAEIDEVVDATTVYPRVIEAIRRHHSQRSDGERHIAERGDDICRNYFVIKT